MDQFQISAEVAASEASDYLSDNRSIQNNKEYVSDSCYEQSTSCYCNCHDSTQRMSELLEDTLKVELGDPEKAFKGNNADRMDFQESILPIKAIRKKVYHYN
ncbi:hypothetical protein [Photobacterium leiognathi]|uniref:hypothetical protein n=1 Tax=Photobacterium leiognathi TaxID=553611 RepID=UPI002980C55F|nr:hypothetical protein [Photobacterium leiognathi]